MRRFYVYILASRSRQLYIGVTSDIYHRVDQHRTEKRGFTGRYRVDRLVYVETTDSSSAAIAREKQIKGWLRTKKVALIESGNPAWNDLAGEWFGPGAAGRPAAAEPPDPSRTADPSLRSG
jgi:putative endonuclease